ncbi:MAG: tRNA glutamyl-Q(34) synthetase GluQRS [Burkholderiales bacterium]|nr:tRNA glutamyl-Q(34) synthetase GluQRS [Burkholderiales bacterium]
MNACRGRFAPSPTGPLHFGSLVAAVASWCEARARGGQWLLRIEDLDPPRCAPGAAEDILATLERLGLDWDGTPMRQSTRGAAYAAALERLADHVFPCACSRREIADSALNPQGEQVYPGTCRGGLPPGRGVRSSRLRVDECEIEFTDAVQGRIRQSLARDVGDFVLRRADGVFAYQLAVVVDDAEQGISHVVRGADLLASTPRQIYLQRLLGLPTPHYAHVPVALNAAGEKLSKQTLAEAIDPSHPAPALAAALAFLGQSPPPELARARARDLRDWALAHWSLERVPRVRAR